MKQTAESVEAEAAIVRSQLVAVGAGIRRRADPRVIVDAAKASFKRRAEEAPALLKENAGPVGMVLLGGAIGAALTGLFSQSRRPPSVAPTVIDKPAAEGVARPSARSQAKLAVLSAIGIGLGYFAGMLVPSSPAEEQLFGVTKAVLRERLDEFLKEHMRGMHLAVANLFGVSRLSATTLVGLAVLAEVFGAPRTSPKPDSP